MASFGVLCAVLSASLLIVAVDADCEDATQFATAYNCFGVLYTLGNTSLCNASTLCRMRLDQVLANCTPMVCPISIHVVIMIHLYNTGRHVCAGTTGFKHNLQCTCRML